MEKKNLIRKILCIIFSFLMSLVLFALALSSTAYFTGLNRDFVANELEKTGFADTLYQKILSELSNEGYISGFDEDFFATAITPETVKASVLSSLDKIYGVGDYNAVPVEDTAEKLAESFVKDLEANGVTVDDEQRTHLEAFAKECAQFLSSNARLPFISMGESLVRNVKPLLKYATIFLGVFVVFCAWFLLFINPKKREAMRWFSYALGGSALMTVTPPSALIISGIIKKISIADKALYDLVQATANDLIYILLAVSIALFVCSAILCILSCREKTE